MIKSFKHYSILTVVATFGIIAGLTAALFIGNAFADHGVQMGDRAAAATIIIEK